MLQCLAKNKAVQMKKIILAIVCMFFIPVVLLLFVTVIGYTLVFGNIAKNTVVQTVESPCGKYYAEVIDSDQGALGGDTIVNVYEKNGIYYNIFKIKKKPQRVYSGEWGEFQNMEIYWKDEQCLVINSVEYEIE